MVELSEHFLGRSSCSGDCSSLVSFGDTLRDSYLNTEIARDSLLSAVVFNPPRGR